MQAMSSFAASPTLKQCSSCRQLLPLAAFHRRRHYVTMGVRAACRDCTAAKAKARRDETGVQHDPKKEQVRTRTRAAVHSGKLVMSPCVECGDLQVEAHHPSYEGDDAHLVVEWLCRLHHAARHGKRSWTRQLEMMVRP